MGKLEGEEEATIAIPDSDTHPVSSHRCFQKCTCGWIISVVLGLHLLVLAALSIYFHERSGSHSDVPSVVPWEPHIQASFRLRRPASLINASLSQLQVDLQDEIGIPNTQVDVTVVIPLSANWTEVQFAVSPDPSNDSILPAELSLLKETFVELFMERSVNLSLSSDLFGKAAHFEVLQFPGGITVVPEQPGFPLSRVLVLFNFTLHNSLSHIASHFTEFREQLANGIILKANESLFVQLTNLEGSTTKSPLIVQTSILPVVGIMLPPRRLKQLAQEIIASPRNLGLNHTLFGKVKKIELSSYLEHSLKPVQPPSPSPSPAPAGPPGCLPLSYRASPPKGLTVHPRHHHRHHRHSYNLVARAPSAVAPAPQEGRAAPPYPDVDYCNNPAAGMGPSPNDRSEPPAISPTLRPKSPDLFAPGPSKSPSPAPASLPPSGGKSSPSPSPAPSPAPAPALALAHVSLPAKSIDMSPPSSNSPSEAPSDLTKIPVSASSKYPPSASPTSSAWALEVQSLVMLALLVLTLMLMI